MIHKLIVMMIIHKVTHILCGFLWNYTSHILRHTKTKQNKNKKCLSKLDNVQSITNRMFESVISYNSLQEQLFCRFQWVVKLVVVVVFFSTQSKPELYRHDLNFPFSTLFKLWLKKFISLPAEYNYIVPIHLHYCLC